MEPSKENSEVFEIWITTRSGKIVSWTITGLLSIAALTGCNFFQTASKPVLVVSKSDVSSIIPTPNSLVGITSPTSQGDIVVLAGSTKSRGLYNIHLSDGSQSNSQSVSNNADALTETNNGVLLMGQGTHDSGAVSIVNSTSLSVSYTIPVGGPVISMTVGPSPNVLYVLTSNQKTSEVSLVNVKEKKVISSIPMSLGTLSIATDGQTLYGLQANGDVQGISLQSKKPVFQFSAVKNPVAFVLSPDDQTLYILKRVATGENISVFNLATESQIKVIAAPRGANTIQINPDGTLLYVGVSTSKSSNVQALKTD